MMTSVTERFGPQNSLPIAARLYCIGDQPLTECDALKLSNTDGTGKGAAVNGPITREIEAEILFVFANC